MGGQSGCERRIEVLVKFFGKYKKKNWGGGWVHGGGGGPGLGVRMDVNEEFKFL